jgi:SAM-dependent methyltransferase
MPSSHLLAEPASDPLPLYRHRDGIVAVDLLAAALAHLDFFTWLAENPATPGAICAHFQIHPRPVDVMLTLFNAMGLTTQSGGVFHCTLRAREHLCAGSPWNLGPYYASMKDRQPTLDMVKVLRTGKPANWGSYDPQAWAQAMEREDFATSFTAAMDCRGALLGPALAKRLDLSQSTALLDVAGGSGIYACAVVARHPHLRAAVFERPPVDRIARGCIAKQGCADQVEVIAGDMFRDEWPAGFDTHLISNVLHDWDEPAVRELLAKSHAALPAGGTLIIHDAHINAEKTGPLHVAEYSALLMNITEGKCYSVAEMGRFLADAGFEWKEHQPTAVGRSYILARRP